MRAGGPTDSDPQNQADLLTSWGGQGWRVSGACSGAAPCHCASQ